MIKIQNFTFRYNASKNPTLRDITLEFQQGEFVLIAGPSGSGKSSLLRAMNGLIPHFFGGQYSGFIEVLNHNPIEYPPNKLASQVGYLFQNPDNQILMQDVISEIIFGLENLNLPKEEISGRLKEIVSVFNLNPLLNKPILEFSGGQKQIVALSSILAMHPEIILLDEPTSELDPLSSQILFEILRKLHQTGKYLIILIEHNYSKILDIIDRIVFLVDGSVKYNGNLSHFFSSYAITNNISIPPLIGFANFLINHSNLEFHDIDYKIPLNSHDFISDYQKIVLSSLSNLSDSYFVKNGKEDDSRKKIETQSLSSLGIDSNSHQTPLVSLKNVCYHYLDKSEILSDISFDGFQNEVICILGLNGSGKTTLLKLIANILKKTDGILQFYPSIKKTKTESLNKKFLGYVFQNPSIQFYRDTVKKELEFMLSSLNLSKNEVKERIDRILDTFSLSYVADQYPRFISMGEQQRLALACALILNPQIILLDEPTHGMDMLQKQVFLTYLRKIQDEQSLIIIATHDSLLASTFATRIIYLEDHHIKYDGHPTEVLPNLPLFTTEINSVMNQILNRKSKFLKLEEVKEAFHY